jgi:Zn-dependent protease
LVISHAQFIIGWAKPVPYNPYNLRDRKYGEAKVALAGPLGNLILAVIFGLILRFGPVFNLTFSTILASIVYINLLLMVFNLIPIPPLDGSKILAAFLPWDLKSRYLSWQKYSLIILFAFIFIGFDWLLPIVGWLFTVIVG